MEPKLPTILFVHAGAEMYGADRILLELIAGLITRGFPCLVVLPNQGPLLSALLEVGATVHVKNLGVLRRKYFTPLGLLNRAIRLTKAVAFLCSVIRKNEVQIVHSNTTAVLAGAIAARLTGRLHVWHVHEITRRPLWFVTGIAHMVSRLSHKVVFVSNATRQHMTELAPAIQPLAQTIYNGIDDTRAVSGTRGVIRAQCGWDNSTVVVGMIGRVNWWKGQEALLNAAAYLHQRGSNLKFLLVGGTFSGEEELREKLDELVRAQGLTGQVVIEGFREDVGNVLADIDVFVLPSIEPDPFPTVVLEAMAAGKPVVAFRHGGVCEMIEDGISGQLCEPASTQQLAERISDYASDSKARSAAGLAARQRIDALFTRDTFLSNFTSIYVNLVTPL